MVICEPCLGEISQLEKEKLHRLFCAIYDITKQYMFPLNDNAEDVYDKKFLSVLKEIKFACSL